MRREGWLDRVIQFKSGWWQIAPFNNATRALGTFRPIEATHYTATDLRATDWTTEDIPKIETDSTTVGDIINQQDEVNQQLTELVDGLNLFIDIGNGNLNGKPWKGTKWQLAVADGTLTLITE
jgi:hypothetical protein